MHRLQLSTRQIVLGGLMGSLLMAVKEALAALPGVELVSLLIVLYTLELPVLAPWAIVVFVLLEFVLYGFGLWSWMYLYIWFVLYFAAWALRRLNGPVAWAIVSGTFGLAFGALCTPVYFVTQGVGGAVAWWLAGIPADVTHGVGNFCVMLLLYKPLRRVLATLKRQGQL